MAKLFSTRKLANGSSIYTVSARFNVKQNSRSGCIGRAHSNPRGDVPRVEDQSWFAGIRSRAGDGRNGFYSLRPQHTGSSHCLPVFKHSKQVFSPAPAVLLWRLGGSLPGIYGFFSLISAIISSTSTIGKSSSRKKPLRTNQRPRCTPTCTCAPY